MMLSRNFWRTLVVSWAFLAPVLEAKTLTVVTTSDFHGALDETDGFGSAEGLGGALAALRAQNGGAILWLDGGDLFQGSMISNENEGRPVVDIYNLLGATAAALGNHEFDYGPVGPSPTPKTPRDDPQGALKALVSRMKFPLLAANVKDAQGKTPPWLKPSVLIERGGLKVGIVGASAEETPFTTNILNLKGLTFQNPTEPVISEAKRLRSQGAEIVLVLIHDSTRCKDGANLSLQKDFETCEDNGFLKMVRALPKGLVDAVIGGHTHQPLAKAHEGMIVLQASARGKMLGVATLDSSTKNHRIDGIFEIKLGANFLGKPLQTDPSVTAALKPYREKIRERLNAPAHVRMGDRFEGDKYSQSPLGNLVADASLLGCGRCADLALVNNGTLRAPLSPGDLRYENIFNLVPFDNLMMVVTVTGRDLESLLETGAGQQAETYSWSSNVRGEIRDCKKAALILNGKPVVPEARYRVAVTDFLAFGGSGFSKLGLQDSQRQMAPAPSPSQFRDAVHEGLKALPQPIRLGGYSTLRVSVTGRCEAEQK